ncbi:MAG: hypothetical protein K2Q20_00650, partial [Phycisphaerales bacterium]|nr:hypothetical protein [Phycisphaerales bacterium]
MGDWRVSVRAIAAVLCVVFLAPRAGADQATSCLSGIEEWMRGAQLRAQTLQERTIVWPGCCDNGSAPAYPPDGYYREALRDNPQLAADLVRACWSAMHLAPTYGYSPLPTYFWDAGENDDLADKKFADMQPPQMQSATMSPSESNYCEVFAALRTDLRKLRGFPKSVSQMITKTGFAASGCLPGINARCNADGQAALGEARADMAVGATVICEATDNVSVASGWQWNPYQPPVDGDIGVIEGGDTPATKAYRNVTGVAPDTQVCWQLRGSADSGFLTVDLSRLTMGGSAKLYVQPYRVAPGPIAGSPVGEPPVGSVNAVFKRLGGASLPSVYTSEPYADLQGPPMTFSEDDAPPPYIPGSGAPPQPGYRGWRLGGAVALVLPRWDAAPDSTRKCGQDCAECVAGKPQVALGGSGEGGTGFPTASMVWSLGRIASGGAAGTLSLEAVSADQAVISAAAVRAVRNDATVANYPQSGASAVRQFATELVVAEVAPLGGGLDGFAVRFYHRSDSTIPADPQGLVTFQGPPFATTT